MFGFEKHQQRTAGKGAAMGRGGFADYVERRIKELHLTKTAFARRAGISRSELYKLLSQDVGQARLETLRRLARAMNMDVLQLVGLLVRPGDAAPLEYIAQKYPGDRIGIFSLLGASARVIASGGGGFRHSWEVKNAGSVRWEGRRVVCVDDRFAMVVNGNGKRSVHLGPRLLPEQREIELPNLGPGDSTMLTVVFATPRHAGTATSRWKVVDREGDFCFPGLGDITCVAHVLDGVANEP